MIKNNCFKEWTKKEVAGIIINEKLSIIAKLKLNMSKVEYVNSLAGRVNYVLSIESEYKQINLFDYINLDL